MNIKCECYVFQVELYVNAILCLRNMLYLILRYNTIALINIIKK